MMGRWVADRLREPSTWQGLAALLAATGLLSSTAVNALVAASVAMWGAVDIIRRERAR